MAGNSSTFQLRQQMNESNLKQWQNWSVDINYVVSQFNDVVQNLTDKLELVETTANALQIKLNKLIEKSGATDIRYVKLQSDTISINSMKNVAYTKPCGVFSMNDGNPHMISIFSTRTIDGLYVNDNKVYTAALGEYYKPFLQIAGSDAGTIVTIKTDNMTKLGDDIELYFSIDPSLYNGSVGEGYKNVTNNDIARLIIKPIYSQVVTKQIISVNNSALSKALVNTTAMSTDAIPVSKYGASVGVYSTTKTIAQLAKNKRI